jgi:hypothetical protein
MADRRPDSTKEGTHISALQQLLEFVEKAVDFEA